MQRPATSLSVSGGVADPLAWMKIIALLVGKYLSCRGNLLQLGQDATDRYEQICWEMLMFPS
jgi:hypothetical protein